MQFDRPQKLIQTISFYSIQKLMDILRTNVYSLKKTKSQELMIRIDGAYALE